MYLSPGDENATPEKKNRARGHVVEVSARRRGGGRWGTSGYSSDDHRHRTEPNASGEFGYPRSVFLQSRGNKNINPRETASRISRPGD